MFIDVYWKGEKLNRYQTDYQAWDLETFEGRVTRNEQAVQSILAHFINANKILNDLDGVELFIVFESNPKQVREKAKNSKQSNGQAPKLNTKAKSGM